MTRIASIALSAWRVASFLSEERGPFAITERLRQRFPDKAAVILTGAGYREMTEIDDLSDGVLMELSGLEAEIGRLLRCPYCSSVWLSCAFAWLDRQTHGRAIVDALAAAGIVQAVLDLTHLVAALEASAAETLTGVDLPDDAD